MCIPIYSQYHCQVHKIECLQECDHAGQVLSKQNTPHHITVRTYLLVFMGFRKFVSFATFFMNCS